MASNFLRARRYAFWRGFIFTLAGITGWFYISGIAGGIAP